MNHATRPRSPVANKYLDALAEALHADVEILLALASGEIHAEIAGTWPTGGMFGLSRLADLEAWRECQRAVADYGREAVRAKEDRDRAAAMARR